MLSVGDYKMSLWDDIKETPGAIYDSAKVFGDGLVNDNDQNVDFEGRRDAIRTVGGLLTVGAAGRYGPEAVSRGASAARNEAGRWSIERRDGETDETDTPTETEDPTETPDPLEYNQSDLPYDSIVDGLNDQEDFGDVFEDFVVNAYRERDRSVSKTVNDALLKIDGKTAEEYLKASSSERESTDVYLGFKDGDELKLRGSSSADLNEEFEEYMAGIEYLGKFDDEVEDYVQDIDDSFN